VVRALAPAWPRRASFNYGTRIAYPPSSSCVASIFCGTNAWCNIGVVGPGDVKDEIILVIHLARFDMLSKDIIKE
jgi:hypothetical protein